MTAMATGTLLVDHATALRSDPARSTRRSMPSGDTARPSSPPSEAARRAKLARSAAERIPPEDARGALAGWVVSVVVLVSLSASGGATAGPAAQPPAGGSTAWDAGTPAVVVVSGSAGGATALATVDCPEPDAPPQPARRAVSAPRATAAVRRRGFARRPSRSGPALVKRS